MSALVFIRNNKFYHMVWGDLGRLCCLLLLFLGCFFHEKGRKSSHPTSNPRHAKNLKDYSCPVLFPFLHMLMMAFTVFHGTSNGNWKFFWISLLIRFNSEITHMLWKLPDFSRWLKPRRFLENHTADLSLV